MTHKSYRKESRANYGTSANGVTLEQLNAGSLMRIADAAELMCKDREKLESGYAYMRGERDRYRIDLKHAERRIAALKGVITKLKKDRPNG